jgi:hypothetical protein
MEKIGDSGVRMTKLGSKKAPPTRLQSDKVEGVRSEVTAAVSADIGATDRIQQLVQVNISYLFIYCFRRLWSKRPTPLAGTLIWCTTTFPP